MGSFFESIGGFFQAIWTLISSALNYMTSFFMFLGNMAFIVIDVLGTIPFIVGLSMSAIVTFAIIKFSLGR